MKSLCIIVCNSLAPEISHLLRTGAYPDVKLKSFQSTCVGCKLNSQQVNELISRDSDRFSKIVVPVCSCYSDNKLNEKLHKKVKILKMEQCFEMFLNLPLIYHLAKQGNYLVTNGWLRQYRRHIEEWGFTKNGAQRFFHESLKKILLLETGLPGDYQSQLKSFSDYLGLPFEVLPVGNDHLKRMIDSIVCEWKDEVSLENFKTELAQRTREMADYSLVFSQLKKLIDHTDEKTIINEILNLLNLLFAPEQIRYNEYFKGELIKENSSKEKNIPFDLKDCIEVPIEHLGETMASFQVYKVKFPEYLFFYQSIKPVISQIGGLALSNARRYSELEKTKQDLQLSEEKYRLITENASDVIWVLNLNQQKFTYVSPAIFELRGYTVEEALNEKVSESVMPESFAIIQNELKEKLPKFLNSKQEEEYSIYELQQPCKNGGIIWVEVSTKFRFNKKGEVEVLGVSRNIEERKKMEEEIRNNQIHLIELNATKDKFFSIIAHDLRGPFSSLLNLAVLLNDEEFELPKVERKRILESLQTTAETTYNLLENLLEWSRLQRGVIPYKPEKLSIKTLFEQCDPGTFEIAREKGITIETKVQNDIVAMADINMVKSVLRNLVINAIKFTHPGGKVLIEARVVKSDQVEISVLDNGIGMTTDIISRLFRIDSEVSRPGTGGEPSTGLGLILCKEFVEKHGGEIWAESVEGSGSKFIFTLPLK